MSWKSLFLRYYSKFYATLLHVRDKNYHLIRKLCKNTSTRSLSTRMLFQKRNDNTFSSTRDRRYTYSFARYHPKFFQFSSNSRTIWFQTIRLFVTSRLFNTTKKKKTHLLSPFFLLYPSILADTPRSHYRGKGEKEAREERKNGVAKKGGERKREFSDPLFYPPLLPRSKSREPLSHRLLDACKYPWQRGATMGSDPLAFAY